MPLLRSHPAPPRAQSATRTLGLNDQSQGAGQPYSRRGAVAIGAPPDIWAAYIRSVDEQVLGDGMSASPSAWVSRTGGAFVTVSVPDGEQVPDARMLEGVGKSGNVANNKGASSSLKQTISFKSGELARHRFPMRADAPGEFALRRRRRDDRAIRLVRPEPAETQKLGPHSIPYT